MYCKWLGDCFLLTFRNGKTTNHVMIDCGALVGTPNSAQKVRQTADAIAKETDGKLAALVVTHEHWDHISGFSDAIDSFKTKFRIGEVWAAWTEDSNQDVARESKKRNQKRFAVVQAALRVWGASDSEEDQLRGKAVETLMNFMPPGGFAAFSERSDKAMNNALALSKNRLLNPGDILETIPGVRVYVLGPPNDMKALRKMQGTKGKEMYGLDMLRSQIATTEAFVAAATSQNSPSTFDHYQPFEAHVKWDEAAWSSQWRDLAKSYNSEPRRKIDRDWLNSAAELALQLDNYTNNTSLVLAFEIIESKEVLLFVGDAQIGNWQSWATVSFADSTVTADLLARTVFYKVGHHGSHNATLEEGGLEAMTSPKLVAAIPVDESFARNTKHWDMPAGPLLNALLAKTKGRVLRADSNYPIDSTKPSQCSETEWQEFIKNTNANEHFIEYFLRSDISP